MIKSEKVIMAGPPTGDYIFIFLYHGLCEALGSKNVLPYGKYDYLNPPADLQIRVEPPYYYSYYPLAPRSNEAPSKEEISAACLNGEVSAIIVSEAYTWDSWFRSWDDLEDILNRSQPMKLIYVIGHDSDNVFSIPKIGKFPFSYVFQREILRSKNYPYHPIVLQMSYPERLAKKAADNERDLDIFYSGNPCIPIRQECATEVAKTNLKFLSSNISAIPYQKYFEVMGRSKFVVCPPGAGWDCARNWECASLGCIPVFIRDDDKILQPNFFNETEAIFVESPTQIIDAVKAALPDWKDRSNRCFEKYLKYHTTKARAEYFLKEAGLCQQSPNGTS